jgi:GT2 family glycosyltransferase
MRILCSISTKNRYDTFLPLAIQSIINQTRLPDKLVIFDDNDNPKDTREDPKYKYLFSLLDNKNIPWEVIFAAKKGQHYNHQIANSMGYDWVWRVDDDNSPEQNVLENLSSYIADDVGAIGGSIITPEWGMNPVKATGKIEDLDNEPNIQWGKINEVKEVDHLHCSFLYRAGIVDYNLGLSKVAHREETLFTYQLKQKGYKNLVIPNTITWHAKSSTGGIRSQNLEELYNHDEKIFRNIIELEDRTIVVLDCGMGDHIVFKHVLPDIKNPLVFSCYPDIVPGRSIAEAVRLYGDINSYNIYRKMDEWNWTDSLENAFRKLYGVSK